MHRCAGGPRLEGDAELVDQLNGALGRGPAPLLRPLPVDLADLANVPEGDPSSGGGRADLQTGQVWPQFAIDDAEEFGEDDPRDWDEPSRWGAGLTHGGPVWATGT